jgi:hypothetical protein
MHRDSLIAEGPEQGFKRFEAMWRDASNLPVKGSIFLVGGNSCLALSENSH